MPIDQVNRTTIVDKSSIKRTTTLKKKKKLDMTLDKIDEVINTNKKALETSIIVAPQKPAKIQKKSPLSNPRTIPMKNIKYKKGKQNSKIIIKANKNSSEMSTASNQASKEFDFSKLKDSSFLNQPNVHRK